MRLSKSHIEREPHADPQIIRAVFAALGIAALIGISLVVVI